MSKYKEYMDIAMESGVKKAGEKAVDRALNALMDFVEDKYGKAKVALDIGFQRYLENAMHRYNQVRTIATGQSPRTIIGEDSIYVNVGLSYKGQEIDTSSVESMLSISNNLLISGSGGVGKSMLMRYLFLNTAIYGEYIPVLVELRRISNQTAEELSILELIYNCMQEFDVQLPKEQFEYSLQLGKYLFLFDGLDEVKISLSTETAEALQRFCAKYPKNPCIITTRPREESLPLETFTVMGPMPLSKSQAVQLATLIWPGDEKAQDFFRQLDEVLYEKHQDFAETPLLLSMMFLTFMRNSSIPDHLADFYQKAYDALYSIHDSHDKGNYRRDFKCKTLDEDDFKRLLAHFCFQSYLKEVYEFSEADILSRLTKSVQKLSLMDVKPKDYLADLCDAVCMLIKDGDTYRFSHRSFQTYFAAYYTSCVLTDEQQKQLFYSLLAGSETFWEKRDYYLLLSQIEPERFAVNALEDGLRTLQKAAAASSDPVIYILKSLYYAFDLSDRSDSNVLGNGKRFGFYIRNDDYYSYNIVRLFREYVKRIPHRNDDDDIYTHNISIIKNYVEKLSRINGMLSFKEIDESDCISAIERNDLYSAILQCNRTKLVYIAITNWLSEVDSKRTSLQSPNFIDDL